ncbi:hypothetical protein MWG92_14550 [Escherichia coli]|nr:hypothetical protein [Escherichia coli]
MSGFAGQGVNWRISGPSKSRLILKTDSSKDVPPGDVYNIMKIISVTGITVVNTENVHLFSDSSEKKTGKFYLKKQSGNYNCPVRGSIPSYTLMQATDNIPDDITFKAYYLPYKKNDITSLPLEKNSDVNYFFTDILDGCSVGIHTEELITRVYHANAFRYGEFLYRKEKMNCSFALRRQVSMQNKMIKNASENNAKIISPWHYGHHGENAVFYKTLFFGYRENFSGSWCFLRQTYDIRNMGNSWFR